MDKSRFFSINGRSIGSGFPPYVIAEISANHNGNLDNALSIMELAKKAGVDAIKIQTYTADTITINSNNPDFVLTEGLWAGENLYGLYNWAHTPWDWHKYIFEKGEELGITVFSSPFDPTAVDFLEQFNPPAYKVASFELVDIPLIEYIASKGRPMIMSTGMAEWNEIMEAVSAAYRGGCKDLCLLHCTSGYPTPIDESDLKTIPELFKRFDTVVGISDHSLGNIVPITAVALGACIIEKHVTLSRSIDGPDSSFSLEPDELKDLVESVKSAWDSLGRIRIDRPDSEKPQKMMRRSIYSVSDIKKGERITEKNVRSIRPGYGLPPRDLPGIIGHTARVDIPYGTALKKSYITK
ncbi:pseudaminic acid synthase [bacterium]|jgi:pseudaminic acid synthase|nr:pseudaminic acid synthase [bacterium]